MVKAQTSDSNQPTKIKKNLKKALMLKNYECILDEKSLDKWIKILEEKTVIAVDTETSSLNPLETELVGISFSYEKIKLVTYL